MHAGYYRPNSELEGYSVQCSIEPLGYVNWFLPGFK